MAIYHATIKDTGEYFVITPENRTINVPQGYKTIGTIGENLSEQITFKCPAVIDGHNVADCQSKYVAWENAVGEPGATALTISRVDKDYIYLTWTLKYRFTSERGEVKFAVVFEDIYDEENEIENYRWATKPCTKCRIANTLFAPTGDFVKEKIYGVDGVGQEEPTLTRTDDAIGLSYTIGASEIVSDFNNCYPWSDMEEVTDSLGNVFIRIPKFYTKITKNTNGTYKYQISGTRYVGFSTLFIDGKGNEIDYVLVGKYEGTEIDNRVASLSGYEAKRFTAADIREKSLNNGEGYQAYDWLIHSMIQQLFMIEFATTNSQSIMAGWTNRSNTATLRTGHTDRVPTPSGSWNNNHDEYHENCNSDGLHACKYRGIENPWGNVRKFVDGIYIVGKEVFVCTDPTGYSQEGKTSPYFYMGDTYSTGDFRTSSGGVQKIALFDKMKILSGVVSEINYPPEPSKYYCDTYDWRENDGAHMFVGGSYSSTSGAGLWAEIIHPEAIECPRLCYKPIKSEETI